MLKTFYLLALVPCLWGGVGCSSNSTAPKEPEKCKLQVVSGAIIASPYINPTVAGEPRPVQLRLYQLKSDTAFLNSSFEQVWQDDKTALGDTLVKVEELSVYPNTRVTFKFERDDKAQFLTAAALFREPKGRTWFTSFELPPPSSAGSCGAKCSGGECDAGAPQNYRIFIWIDGTSVQDGADHAEDFPEGRQFNADGSETSASKEACGSVAQDAKNAAIGAASAAVTDGVKPPEMQPPTVPTK